tara:strand:+ start:1517 stop:2080 length:564 start_codon:yes stop_codon:yes gene_type:complete
MDEHYIRLAEKTLAILKKKSWSTLDLKELYKFNKSDKKNLNKKIKRKTDLIINIIQYFDTKLINDSNNIDQSSSKDMIFELMMIRFDILQKHRKQIINIYSSIKNKPQEIIFIFPAFIESMIMMSKISNISIKGIKGNLKIKGLCIIYFSSFLIWIKDDTNSLEKTMKSLDKYLDQAGKILNFVEKR